MPDPPAFTDAPAASRRLHRLGGRGFGLVVRGSFGGRLQQIARSIGGCGLLLGCFVIAAAAGLGLSYAKIDASLDSLWTPDSGRLQSELGYVERVAGAAVDADVLVLQVAGEDGNLVSPRAMLDHLQVLQKALRVSVDLFDVSWSLVDLCYSASMPSFEAGWVDDLLAKAFPCVVVTPLDCFWEGAKLLGPAFPLRLPGFPAPLSWTNLHPMNLLQQAKSGDSGGFPFDAVEGVLRRAGVGSGYVEKPCLDPRDPGCPSTAPNYNGKPADVAGELSKGCAGFAPRLMRWPTELLVGGQTTNSTGQITSAGGLLSTVQLMSSAELFEFFRDTWRVHHVEWTPAKATQVIQAWQSRFAVEVNHVTADLNLEFRSFTASSLDAVLAAHSRFSPAAALSRVLILAVFSAALGFAAHRTPASAAGAVLGVALSFAAAAAAAGIAAFKLPFNAVSVLGLPLLCVGICGWGVFSLVGFPLGPRTHGPSLALGAAIAAATAATAALLPVPAVRAIGLQGSVMILVVETGLLLLFPAVLKLLGKQPASPPHWANKIGGLYGMKKAWPWLGLVFIITIGVLGCGVGRVGLGLPITALVPEDAPAHAFLRDQAKLFPVHHVRAVTKANFDYPNNQKLLHKFHEAMGSLPWAVRDEDGGMPRMWLAAFRDWLGNIQKSFDRDWAAGYLWGEGWNSSASFEGILGWKLSVQTGHVDAPVDLTQLPNGKLLDNEGNVQPRQFYNLLSAWASNDPLAYGAVASNLRPEPRPWVHVGADKDLKIPKSQPIKYAEIRYVFRTDPNDQEGDALKLVRAVRQICDTFEARGLPVFPWGIPFRFGEQYVELPYVGAVFVGGAGSAAAALLIFFLGCSARAVLCCGFCAGASAVFILGALGWAHVTLSALSLASALLGVAASLLPPIKLTTAYCCTCLGPRGDRLSLSVKLVVGPSIDGVLFLLAASILTFSPAFTFVWWHVGLPVFVGGLSGLVHLLVTCPLFLLLFDPPTWLPLSPADLVRPLTPSPPPTIKKRPKRPPPPYSYSRGNKHRAGSEHSLSTITEEPHSQAHSNSTHTRRSAEIVVAPQVVVETSGDHNTKVSAKLKVEVNTMANCRSCEVTGVSSSGSSFSSTSSSAASSVENV